MILRLKVGKMRFTLFLMKYTLLLRLIETRFLKRKQYIYNMYVNNVDTSNVAYTCTSKLKEQVRFEPHSLWTQYALLKS